MTEIGFIPALPMGALGDNRISMDQSTASHKTRLTTAAKRSTSPCFVNVFAVTGSAIWPKHGLREKLIKYWLLPNSGKGLLLMMKPTRVARLHY